MPRRSEESLHRHELKGRTADARLASTRDEGENYKRFANRWSIRLLVSFLICCLSVGVMYRDLLITTLGLSALASGLPGPGRENAGHHWKPEHRNPGHWSPHHGGKVCIVDSSQNDTSTAIEAAFQQCGHESGNNRGRVVFKNETYNVRRVMNTTGLSNVDVDIYGTLLWDTDLQYWLNHSLPVGYQNQSSAWLFGGEAVRWNGHGVGTLDGNGQAWYDFINGTNNYPGRPHQVTFTGMKDSVIEQARFVQSQMWTMTIIHSENVLLQDLYINSTDASQAVGFEFSSLNTDGADVIYSDNITFRDCIIDSGDDNIALKANSTNILIENQDWYTGLGFAMGSIGQYDGVFERVENVTVRNVTAHTMRYGAYFKTWTGVSRGYPPNGGGGGRGYAANITMSDFVLDNVTGIFAITQCTSYNDARGQCDTSGFNIRDVTMENWSGTAVSDVVAELQCSGASPCTGMAIRGIEILDTVNGTAPSQFLCGNVSQPVDFTCTGSPWGENNR